MHSSSPLGHWVTLFPWTNIPLSKCFGTVVVGSLNIPQATRCCHIFQWWEDVWKSLKIHVPVTASWCRYIHQNRFLRWRKSFQYFLSHVLGPCGQVNSPGLPWQLLSIAIAASTARGWAGQGWIPTVAMSCHVFHILKSVPSKSMWNY